LEVLLNLWGEKFLILEWLYFLHSILTFCNAKCHRKSETWLSVMLITLYLANLIWQMTVEI